MKKNIAFFEKYGILYSRDYRAINCEAKSYFIKGGTEMFGIFKKKKTNYAKIIVITIAVAAAVALIAFIIYKLVKKYSEDLVYDCDDLLDECDDCDLVIDDADDIDALAE